MQDDLWKYRVPNTYRPGTIVTVRVSEIAKFGIRVEIEPGVKGLIHNTELVGNVSIGQTLRAVVLHVDEMSRKVGLSAKRAGSQNLS